MTGTEPASAPAPGRPRRTARERAHAEVTAEILDAARQRLSTQGAAALSLRAVARDLGMASSAIYRYVAGRDELLTRLITEAYGSLGDAVERREATCDPGDFTGRFSAICHGVRQWALSHPHEYALIYGSPVPGYAAPTDTIGPASRVSLLLAQVVADSLVHGGVPRGADTDALPPPVSAAVAPVRAVLPAVVPDGLVVAGLMVWTGLFGAVSFELFGQLHNVLSDNAAERDAYFTNCVQRWAAQLGR